MGVVSGAVLIDDKTGVSWDFAHIEEDIYLKTDIIVYNDTTLELNISLKEEPGGGYGWHLALCNMSNVDWLKYQNEDNQGGFNYSTPIAVNYGYLQDYGLPDTWCNMTDGYGYVLFANTNKNQLPIRFRLHFPEGIPKHFYLFTGDSTEVIDSTAAGRATAITSNENIVRTSDGLLHAGYRDASSKLSYANSSNNGLTWGTKTVSIFLFTFDNIGILANSSDDLYLYYLDQSFLPNILRVRISTNNGLSFGGFQNVIGAVNASPGAGQPTRPSGVMDGNDIAHFCAIDSWTGGILRYSNSSGWTNISINDDPTDDSDLCDIAVDGDGNVCIATIGSDGKDLDVFCSTDYWTRHSVHENVINAFGSPSDATSPSITVDNDGMFYIAYGVAPFLGTELWVANFTASDLTAFTTTKIDTAVSFFYDIAVSSQGDIHILYTDSVGLFTTSDIYHANKSYNAATWTKRQHLQATAGYPSIRDSRFPFSNRMQDELQYVFTNVSSRLMYDNFTIPYGTCFPEPENDWAINLEDECTNYIERDIRPYNFSTSGSSGFFTTLADIITGDVFLDIHGGDVNCIGGFFKVL